MIAAGRLTSSLIGRSLAVLVLAIVACTGSRAETLAEKSRPSIVFLKYVEVVGGGERQQRIGTAFIVNDQGVLITAFHVVEAWVHQMLSKKDPEAEKARNPLLALISSVDAKTPIAVDVIVSDAATDIAILKLKGPGPYHFVPICFKDKMSSGEKVEAYGFPLGKEFTPFPGLLSNDNAPEGRWSANISFETGVSGGPVFDVESGQVIGIAKGGLVRRFSTATASDQVPVPSVNYVTPILRAQSLLANVGVQSNCTPPAALNDKSAEKDQALQQLEELFSRMALLSALDKEPQAPFSISDLSRRYEGQESSNIGTDAAGRFYYGIYRIQDGPNMEEFIAFLSRVEPAFAGRLKRAGGSHAAALRSMGFVREWQALAQSPKFAKLQSDFITHVDYRRLSARVKRPPNPSDTRRNGLSLDLDKRSLALRAVFFSIAVQYGPQTSLPFDALEPLMPLDTVPDEDLIKELYKFRDKVELYFPQLTNSLTSNQLSVLIQQRNRMELKDALYILAKK